MADNNPSICADMLLSGPAEPKPEWVTWADFLASYPPSSQTPIAVLGEKGSGPYDSTYYLPADEIRLHCESELCQGMRFFERIQRGDYLEAGKWENHFVEYRCKNCEETHKSYAVRVKIDNNYRTGMAIKIGEWPAFGEKIPSRAMSLVGGDRELFLKGRRAENLGMGLGSYAYYRRVVENQKVRIIGEIVKVAQKIGASETIIDELVIARDERQFKKAIEIAKDAFPAPLLIHGENPLLLLHGALSESLHNHTDEECLELAKSIRVVLTELAARITAALAEKDELDMAVKRLMQTRQKAGR